MSKILSKIILKSVALFLFISSFLFAATPALAADSVKKIEAANKVVILNYHKIDNMFHSLSILPGDFRDQLKYLKDNGFQSITLDELCDALNGKGELPEKPLIITFDDGYRDNYENAYPLLKEYGFKGVIFIVTKFLDDNDPNYLTWEMAREMEESGIIDIESHTVNHSSMTEVTDEKLRWELAESKRVIEDKLEKTVSYVAYPTGTFNLHIANIVKEVGYKAAFTIKYGIVDDATNLYAIERLPVFHTSSTFDDFRNRLKFVPTFARFSWIKS